LHPRRHAALLIAAILLAGTAAGCRGTPNVLLIVLDTARADALSVSGREGTLTPTLDALAEDGVYYPRARSTSAWTVPSHGSLFTGLYPSRHGAHHESHLLAPEHTTLAELLAPTHATVGFSENPHIGQAKGYAQGFGHYEETWRERRGPDDPPTIPRVLDWLRKRDPERPFFLFVNLMDPHLPYRPPPHLQERLLPAGVDAAQVQQMRGVNEREARLFMTRALRLSVADLDVLRALYNAEVAAADERVSRLLAALDRQELREDTLIIVVGDHGENIGEHGLMEHQLCLYETLLRVPLILWLPGTFEGGAVRDAPVQLVDIPPTVLDVARVPESSWPAMEGQSLRRGDPPADRPVLAEYMRPVRQRLRLAEANPDFDFTPFDRRLKSIQVGSIKLVTSDRGETELFDLDADPGEARNLAALQPELVERLRTRLVAWSEAGGPVRTGEAPELDPETREALRALGYAE
jgi:arylsulfatase A-like enzyme